MNLALISGFSLGFSLILAIGAQNAFVLRQGLRGEHVFIVALICALSDSVLITLGVSGMGAFVKTHPSIIEWLRWAGVAFLLFYGVRSFRSALRSDHVLEAAENVSAPLWPTIGTALILTWANPHVYLDTVVLLGSVATQFGQNAFFFGVGAAIASFVFFFGLAYGASILRGPFRSPRAWRALDIFVGIIMWAIAFGLANGNLMP